MSLSVLHIVFSVAGAEYVLSADDVLQIESYVGATPVPGALPYVTGVTSRCADARRPGSSISGRASASARGAAGHRSAASLVGQINDRTVGLLVDSAREVVKLAPRSDPGRLPPRPMAEGAEGFVRGGR